MSGEFVWRTEPRPGDPAAVREIILSTGYFHDYEVDVAVELVEERLAKGLASGYHFVLVEQAGRLVGYSCYGPIPCTRASHDLYWIAVHDTLRGQGLGRELLQRTEQAIAAQQGLRIYVETSSKAQYEPTRQFYLHCDYRIEAVLEDFYEPGDGKVILVKKVGP